MTSTDSSQTTAHTRSGIDTSALDPATRPQDDLFRHVNGRWIATYEIPPDRAMDGAFRELYDQAERDVRDIIEEAGQAATAGADATAGHAATAGADAAAGADAEPGQEKAQIGALYASFMDADRVEELGAQPLREDLALIEAASSTADLVDALGALQRTGAGGAVGFWVDNDAKDPERYVVYLSQSGLGLPD